MAKKEKKKYICGDCGKKYTEDDSSFKSLHSNSLCSDCEREHYQDTLNDS